MTPTTGLSGSCMNREHFFNEPMSKTWGTDWRPMLEVRVKVVGELSMLMKDSLIKDSVAHNLLWVPKVI